MRLLLDTHAFIWWVAGNPSLSFRARTAIADAANDVFVSSASAWEISTKHRLGKLPLARELAINVEAYVEDQGFFPLDVTMLHGQAAGSLPGIHRDPFDRMLIAQAIAEKLILVSNEELFDEYAVQRLW